MERKLQNHDRAVINLWKNGFLFSVNRREKH